MATRQVKTKAQELMDSILLLGEANSAPVLDVARLKQGALSLRSSDLYGASLALGMLAALEFDEVEMKKNHELAIRLRPDEYFSYRNFAASLARFICFAEARAYALKAYQVAKSNIDAIDFAIVHCVATGHFGDATQLLEARENLNPVVPCAYEDIVRPGNAFLLLHDIQVDEIDTLQSIGQEVLRNSGIYAKWVEPRLMEDEESEWLSFDLVVAEPVDIVVDLNMKLARRLAETSPSIQAESSVLVTYMVAD